MNEEKEKNVNLKEEKEMRGRQRKGKERKNTKRERVQKFTNTPDRVSGINVYS